MAKSNIDSSRTAILIRLDPKIAEALQELAQLSDLSVNQLVSGLVRWAVLCGHPGRPVMSEEYLEVHSQRKAIVGTKPGGACVWFGEVSYSDMRGWDRDDGGPMEFRDDDVVLQLDYSEERGVIASREELGQFETLQVREIPVGTSGDMKKGKGKKS